jgi:hypothetical protein
MAKQEAQTTFESILDTPADEVNRPVPMPTGTYDCVVKGLYEEGKSSKKGTPFVKFTYAFVAAGEDVDEDELMTILTDKDGNVAPLNTKTVGDTYYTTNDALYRLTDNLENMGIDLDGKSVRQALSETPNCDIRVLIGHRPSEDGTQIYAEVKRTMKAE